MSGIENSKLCLLLETFTTKEISSFCDFISSPFYNKNKTLITLTKELVKIHPNYFKLTKDKLENKSKSTNIVRDMSLVLKLAERFLVICHIEENKILSDFTKISGGVLSTTNEKVFSASLLTISVACILNSCSPSGNIPNFKGSCSLS